MEKYGIECVIFLLAVLELIAFCYIYGVERISENFFQMLNRRPNKFYIICWKYITPVVMSGIFIGFISFYQSPVGTNDNLPYSTMAHAFGIFMTVFFLSMLPICFIHELYKSEMGTLKDVSRGGSPEFFSTRNFTDTKFDFFFYRNLKIYSNHTPHGVQKSCEFCFKSQ